MSNAHQMAKFVNASRGGGCKLLGIEGHFAASGDSPAQLTNLCRLVLRANDTTGKESLNLTANIPASEIPAILKLAEIALEDYVVGKREKSFDILSGTAKPKVSDKNDIGTLVYEVSIVYLPDRRFPICVKVKNFRADVSTRVGGSLKYSAPKPDTTSEITYYISVTEFYNAVAHLSSMHQAWYTKAADRGDFGDIL